MWCVFMYHCHLLCMHFCLVLLFIVLRKRELESNSCPLLKRTFEHKFVSPDQSWVLWIMQALQMIENHLLRWGVGLDRRASKGLQKSLWNSIGGKVNRLMSYSAVIEAMSFGLPWSSSILSVLCRCLLRWVQIEKVNSQMDLINCVDHLENEKQGQFSDEM